MEFFRYASNGVSGRIILGSIDTPIISELDFQTPNPDHYLVRFYEVLCNETNQLCEHITFLDSGELVLIQTPWSLGLTGNLTVIHMPWSSSAPTCAHLRGPILYIAHPPADDDESEVLIVDRFDTSARAFLANRSIDVESPSSCIMGSASEWPRLALALQENDQLRVVLVCLRIPLRSSRSRSTAPSLLDSSTSPHRQMRPWSLSA